jgi:hypothetical protein
MFLVIRYQSFFQIVRKFAIRFFHISQPDSMSTDLDIQKNLKNGLLALTGNLHLNWLMGFHNDVRALFREKVEEINDIKNTERERNFERAALDSYDRMLHINTFLMMYSYLEEWLYNGWKAYAPNVMLVDRDGSIGRFKNVVNHLGVDLSSRLWQTLKNTEEIRNCILHANGRISLMRNPHKKNKLLIIIDKKNSGLKIDNDRIEISGEFLQKFNKEISDLMDIVFKA